ncbi:MAG: phosphoribosylamine--glycine ligase [Candidatus Yanofskybacteria bacterium RIFCSPHIGHO2_02_FULL_38_22b]|uniref:phosphoribosylamine--glycine ligase n=1 Tax=Candidatus Yanofskybacteria bacterium RIFCSPHIGHO2_02_FULL_38_22b TaxID=1802673 RepID=A0A1F8F1F9_9BACT|nr:MAG: phosphoribosylamine--glycine ligase [Candidatus Yanofskybacteria bacterium RIFCSPHIGHO2_02_FULL_38_22b]OGN19880.1 MAG: phosphoribosylamine--glycine ligase [Candidatus Yanofskybacteria bacterium RIFCSPLOWO2_01_FULL_39_28]
MDSNGIQNGKPKYKFLFVSWESLSGDLAWKIKNEGHEVKCYIKNTTDEYDGILEKVPEWRSLVDWADVVVFDDVGFGEEADKLRKTGKAVIGGSIYTDKLEEDREFGQSEMKRLGLLTLPSWNFSNYDEALEFIKNNPGRYVYKPSGLSAGDSRGLLFFGKEEDGRDLYEILSQNRKVLEKKIKQFQLQKHVAGVEVGASAFFNGEKFITPVLIAFEHKRLFPGELGEMTGEMGTSMFWSESSKLFRDTTGRMEEDLRKSGYVGYIDINCIVNGRGIYPLEFTTRFGYPTISIQQEGVLSEWGDFFYNIANKKDYQLRTKKGFQVGVVCVVPPFPYDEKRTIEIYKDLSILFKKPSLEGIHLGDVKITDNAWRIAGHSSYVLVVTGSGSTMEEARKQAYSRIDNIMLINMFYRTDIGAAWGEDSDKLMTWGYI